jgi:hypothetical protein
MEKDYFDARSTGLEELPLGEVLGRIGGKGWDVPVQFDQPRGTREERV